MIVKFVSKRKKERKKGFFTDFDSVVEKKWVHRASLSSGLVLFGWLNYRVFLELSEVG